MKLCNLVDIIDNNMECVILKVKDGKRLDLIKLGYFTGDEDIIRLTKGESHTCTVFNKDGKNYSWDWGKGGYTLITDDIIKSLFIRSLDDVKEAQHFIEFMYWRKREDSIIVHKDNEFYKQFKSICDAENHFYKLGYNLYKDGEYIADTGCIVEQYYASKTNEMDCEI